jgi:hypothetical protein
MEELWSAKDKNQTVTSLVKKDDRYEFYISDVLSGGSYGEVDRKHLKDLFNVLGNELNAWNEPEPANCTAEMWSWNYFQPAQIDAYYMRCHLSGDHDEHENSETGAKWRDKAEDGTKRSSHTSTDER